MIKKVLLFSILLSFFSCIISAHEYHVSITEIKQNKEGNLEISMKLFIDDFERAIEKEGINHYIGDDLKEEQVEQLIKEYVSMHFYLEVNTEFLSLTYLGAEWDKDLHSFYVYLESDELEPITELGIYNTIFIEIANDQENMHHIHIGRKKKSLLLNRDIKRSTLDFND